LTVDGKVSYFTSPLYEQEVAGVVDAGRGSMREGTRTRGTCPRGKEKGTRNRDLCLRGIFERLVGQIKLSKSKKVGFESKHLPFLEYQTIQNKVSSFAQLGVTDDLIENLRMIKTVQEIKTIKSAAAISQEAFSFIEEIHDPLSTEKDLTIEIERFLRLRGDNQIAFSPIVASGKNSAFPHHAACDQQLDKSPVIIDLGGRVSRYCADLTRVFFWGKMPPQLKKIYNIIRKAVDLSINAVGPGVKAKQVDKVARSVIDKQGFGKCFVHGLGHGLGLEVHEGPYLNVYNDTVLQPGMVLTIEPAIYLPGKLALKVNIFPF